MGVDQEPRRSAPSENARLVFARNLRAARERAGISQERLSYDASLHRTEISLLERAEREPRLSTIIRLAAALETSPAALLDGISAPPPRSRRAHLRPGRRA